MQLRKEGKIEQVDMIHLLMDAKQEYEVQQQNETAHGMQN